MDTNPAPEVGQVWADNDERTKGSGEFEIVDIFPGIGRDGALIAVVRRTDGTRTRIRVDRLANTGARGYRYIGRAK